jgi:hypothetical protein
VLVGVACGGAIVSGTAHAQVFQVTRLGGLVEVGADIRRQDFQRPDGSDRMLDRNRFFQRIGLETDGYVITPEVATFSLATSVGLRQETGRASDFDPDSDLAKLLRYAGRLSLFPKSFVSLLVFANRYDDDAPQSFGADSETSGDTVGATLRLATRILPLSLTWQQLRAETKAIGGGVQSVRDETRRLWELNGQRFTETWQASLLFRDEDVEDDSEPPVGDSRNREANAMFGYRFGPYLEKSWRTRGRWFERKGDFEFESYSISNHLGWEITEELETRLEHEFDRFDSDGSVTDTHNMRGTLAHDLYESLQTRLRAFGNHSDREVGDLVSYGGSLGFGYRKELPWDSRLRIDLDGYYRVDDSDFENPDDLIAVFLEPHNVEGFNEDILLQNLRIEESTIEVFRSDNGTDCRGDIDELFLGDDYSISSFDSLQTALQILPGGQGGTVVGDVICVNYEFAAGPSAKIGTPRVHVGVGWDAGWILLRYDHDQSKDHRLSGEPVLLQDTRRHSANLELRGSFGTLTGLFGARYVRDRTVTVDYDEIMFRQSLTWRPLSTLRMMVQFSEGTRDFANPDRETSLFSANGSILWSPRSDRRLRLFARYRDFDDSKSPNQRDMEFGVRGTIRVAKIELLPLLRWTRSERGGNDARELVGVLRIRRRF